MLDHIPTNRLFDFYDWRNLGAYSPDANKNNAVAPGTDDTSFGGTGHGTNVASIIGANNNSTHKGGAPPQPSSAALAIVMSNSWRPNTGPHMKRVRAF